MIKINAPKGLIEDFEQEVTMVLLELPEEKIIDLHEKNFLSGYFIQVIKNIGIDQRIFNKFYFEKDTSGYARHLSNQQKRGIESTTVQQVYKSFEEKQSGDKNDKHDYIVMTKYIELGSYSKVAKFFRVPKYHIKDTISRLKKELKKEVKDAL